LSEQPPPAGANRGSYGELAMTGLGACEQEIGKVRAGDEQHEADRGLQHPDRDPRRADDLLLHRLHLQRVCIRREHMVLGPGPLTPCGDERGELRLCLRRGQAILHAGDQVEGVTPPVLTIGGIEIERQPQLDAIVHDVETRWHDADDFALDTVDLDRGADDVRSGGERRLPQLARENDQPRAVDSGLIASEPAAGSRRHCQCFE
jgi:hypothetical protein